jgi:sugar phosphate isomerase/epimerase
VENPADRELFLSVLNDLASVGNRQGVMICLIPSGDSAAEVRAVISAVKTGPVTVDADLAAWVLHNLPPASQLRELHELIGHVEIRDAVRDFDGLGKEVPIGRGEIDWDEVAALLGEMDYSGWLNVTRTSGDDRPGDIARGVKFLRNLIPSDDR